MLVNQGYAAYANNKIATASPAELTLMLYEGAIKFCNIAIVGVEEKSIQKTHDNIMKTERIIEELQSTLDHKYPVAKDFDEGEVPIAIAKESTPVLPTNSSTWSGSVN